jgi:hypothetical protein
MKKLNDEGQSLLKLMIAIVILGLISQWVVMSLIILTRRTVQLEDRGYACAKGNQMFNELLSYSNANPYFGGPLLDGYNDGAQYNLVLTADKSVTFPGDPLSGNRQANGHWQFLRQIEVAPDPGNFQARQVTVRVWKCQSDGNPLVPGILLSTTVGTIVPGARPSYAQTPAVYDLINALPWGGSRHP